MNGARYVMGLTRIDFHGVTAVKIPDDRNDLAKFFG